jgi:hypothetical protein
LISYCLYQVTIFLSCVPSLLLSCFFYWEAKSYLVVAVPTSL